jgi:NAD(P)-dependent dehydrogenase (short-subunit alcohol dehydrogenase family)
MKKKSVFISGGSRGIGKAIAEKFLSEGYTVGIGYIKNENFATAISEKYDNAYPIKIDVSKRKSIKQAIKVFEKQSNSSIEILVNNAGISDEKDFMKITDSDWRLMMDTNLMSAFMFTQETIPLMIKRKWGRIINISSIGGQWGGFNQVHYAVSKAGLINLTRSISKLYSKYNITTNAVAVGLVSTDMSENEILSKSGKLKIKEIPTGRIGNLEEIADTVFFLASEESSYITGQTINVNGGMYFGS